MTTIQELKGLIAANAGKVLAGIMLDNSEYLIFGANGYPDFNINTMTLSAGGQDYLVCNEMYKSNIDHTYSIPAVAYRPIEAIQSIMFVDPKKISELDTSSISGFY